jgi:hypothetical protein
MTSERVLTFAAAFAALLLASPEIAVAAPPCKYEENCHCAVPGITVRWEAAYCMYLNETDDLEQGGVQECLARVEPRSLARAGSCAKNAHWKRKLCAALHKGKKKSTESCVQDRAMVPRFVEHGPDAR